MTRSKEVSTSAKREAIAKRLAEIAARHGATCERCNILTDREINLTLRLGRHWVSISLDGRSTWGVLGHWNIDDRRWIYDTAETGWGAPGHWEDSWAPCFPPDFGFTVRGSVNECHYCKATTCTDSMPRFYEAIDAGLTEIARLNGPSRPCANSDSQE